MLVIDRVDVISRSGSDGGGRWWRRGCTSRLLCFGASQRFGIFEVFGMNGVRIGAFHTPPILYIPPMPLPGPSKPEDPPSSSPRSGLVQQGDFTECRDDTLVSN